MVDPSFRSKPVTDREGSHHLRRTTRVAREQHDKEAMKDETGERDYTLIRTQSRDPQARSSTDPLPPQAPVVPILPVHLHADQQPYADPDEVRSTAETEIATLSEDVSTQFHMPMVFLPPRNTVKMHMEKMVFVILMVHLFLMNKTGTFTLANSKPMPTLHHLQFPRLMGYKSPW